MDIEVRCLNAMLQVEEDRLHDILSSPPTISDVFYDHSDLYDYIRGYVLKNSKLPSRPLVRRKFPDFEQKKVRDPFDVLLAEVTLRHQRNLMVTAINEVTDKDLIGTDLEEAGQTLANAFSQTQVFDTKNSESELTTISDTLLANYEERKTGFSSLTFTTGSERMDDHIGGGIAPGQLSVLAGDPKAGKTWWLISLICANYANGKGILVISPELDKETIFARFACYRYQIDYSLFRQGKLPPRAESRLKNRIKKDTLPLHVVDATEDDNFTPSKVAAKIDQYRPGLVIIDSVYYLRADNQSRQQNFKDDQSLVSQLKTLAKRAGVGIQVVVQMDRESERKGISDEKAARHVYGGDAWLQGCDVLFRLRGARNDNYRKLQCLANREGEGFFEDILKYSFDPHPEITSIEEIAADDVSEEDDMVEVEI